MWKLNFKIALRNLWKNRGITAINIGGLAVALAAFILVLIYVTYENTYDSALKGYDRIYLVGRDFPDMKTNYTAPKLAAALRESFPEIEVVAKTRMVDMEFPLTSFDKNRLYVNKTLQMDYAAAKLFGINPVNGLKMPVDQQTDKMDVYIPNTSAKVLFPNRQPKEGELITIGPLQMGQTSKIAGIINRDNNHSNIQFELLAVGKDIGYNEGWGFNNYNTYILVKEGTNIANLQQKIDALYKKAMIAEGWDKNDERIRNRSVIFLDPLKNLHLKPYAGNDTNYKIMMILGVLGLLILVIACINFTNLTIAQANKRAKEVGIKKVMGAYRINLTTQFLVEIGLQCTVAIVFGLILAELAMPLFNLLINSNLSIISSIHVLIWQLPLILVVITLISGLYPAMILSGFRPAYVLKGNMQTSHKTQWLRNALLVTQFTIAVVFIAGLLIVNSQVKFMQTESLGFNPQQVVSIRSMTIFNDPDKFEPFRQKMLKIPGVSKVTVATNIPGESAGGKNAYSYNGKEESINFIDVDFDYFETLDIKAATGRLFSRSFIADTAASVILNESAVKKFAIKEPVGALILSHGKPATVVGVIKDFKVEGFEKATLPTIYAIKNPYGNFKLKIMVKIDQAQMASALAAIKADWQNINPLDGEDFRYDFLDETYGKLFANQQQLRSVFLTAAALTIIIAIMGLFAFAAFNVSNRVKEISVRKILGASNLQILQLLNTNFIRLVIIANVIAFPAAYLLAKIWLNTFAYRIEMPFYPFLIAALTTIGLTILTVSLQAGKAVKANPAHALKYD